MTPQASRPQSRKLLGLSTRLNWGRIGDYLFVVPALIFVFAVLVYPLAYNFYMSVHGVTAGNFLAGEVPFVGLEQYREIIADPAFRGSLWITIIYTVSCLFFQFIIGLALALFFNRAFPGGGVLRALLLLAWMIPLVVTGNLFRWMLEGQYGVLNFLLNLGPLELGRGWLSDPNTALAGVIFTNVWIGIPFNMILLLAGLQSISPTLYEAAKIDGANAIQRFLYVTLPQLRPVMMIVLLLGFIYTFKVFDLIFVMTGGGPVNATTVLPIYVYELMFDFFRFGNGAAASVLVLVLPVSLAVLYLWWLRKEEAA